MRIHCLLCFFSSSEASLASRILREKSRLGSLM